MQRILGTRNGTILVGAIAAILAAAILLVYVAQYRDSVQQEQKPVPVLVAGQLIPKGTTGDVVGSQEMYTVSNMPANRVEDGAITDPNSIKGKVATEDLFPGKQLTESNFAAADGSEVGTKLNEYDRAVAVPLDSAHGLVGYVQASDHVDIIAGFIIEGSDGKQHPVQKTLMQNILVLDAPESSGRSGMGSANGTQNVVLLMNDQQAADLAFASDNGKVWLALRPATGDEQHKPALVTLDTILFGVKPIQITNAYKRLYQRALNGGG
jgi:Flp pilus assembly protein CpaB